MTNLYRIILIGVGCMSLATGYAQQKPNIIFIVIDDVGTGWIPPYAKNLKAGDIEPEITKAYSSQQKGAGVDLEKHLEAARNCMPFLSKLAQQGVVFNKAFNSASLCAPSRAGMLTGRYASSWGAYTLYEVEKIGVPKSIRMLPAIFQAAGYNTGAIGKWHLGPQDTENKAQIDADHFKTSAMAGFHPLDRGFDYYYGFNTANSKYDGAADLWENRSPVAKLDDNEFLTDVLSGKASSFVDGALGNKKPFFLFFAPMTLHGGITPPPEKYKSKFNTGIPFTNIYAGHLLALDEGIKKIYASVEKAGQLNNTFFVLCSDNGAPYPVPPYNAPFKGGKGTGWLGGAHSPLIMVLPGKTKPMYSDVLVSTLDILPTALDLAGITIPNGLDGVSLRKLITEGAQKKPHDILFSAGLHSARWTYNYYDGELKKNQDNADCPFYLWGITDTYYSLQLTPFKGGLYEKVPANEPGQRTVFNYVTDPLNRMELKNNKQADEVSEKAKTWLKKQNPPLRDRKEAYKILTDD